MVTSEKAFSNTTAKLYTYDDIPLKLYLDIAKGLDYKLLVRQGSATEEQCVVAWEAIMIKNGKASSNFDYLNYVETLKAYALLIARYNTIKATLLKLTVIKDSKEDVEYLRSEGYNIDDSSLLKFNNSLSTAMHASNNLITKINSKKKELEKYTARKEDDDKGLNAILVGLSHMVGYKIDNDVTLSEFNEHKLLIQKRNGSRGKQAGASK